MQTILKNVSARIWERKMMLISFFLFVGCAQDESLAPENSLRIAQIPKECGSNAAQMTSGNARLTPLDASTGRFLTESELASMNGVFVTHLSPANEVPATISKGQGQAIFMLNEDGTALNYKLNVANTRDITQAHIHCGESGVNGPVVVFLFGLVPTGVNQNGVLAEGTITAENIIARGSSAACVGGLNSFETLLEKMRNGGAYVNVHTLTYPGGEIRGQIKQ